MRDISYYELLGVSSSAATAEIDQAYARVLDRIQESDDSVDPAVIAYIQEAYRTLSTPNLRTAYDSVREASEGSDEPLLEMLERRLVIAGLEPDVVDLMLLQSTALLEKAVPLALRYVQRIGEAKPFCVAVLSQLLANYLWSRHKHDTSARPLLETQVRALDDAARHFANQARPGSADVILPRRNYASVRDKDQDVLTSVHKQIKDGIVSGVRWALCLWSGLGFVVAGAEEDSLILVTAGFSLIVGPTIYALTMRLYKASSGDQPTGGQGE